jgi:hypothetical protein
VKKSADEKLDVLYAEILSDIIQDMPVKSAHQVPGLDSLFVFLG